MAATMQCISVQTLIFHLVVNFVCPKTLRSALWRCPILTIAIRELGNVTKVTNQKTVKIEFRHLRFLYQNVGQKCHTLQNSLHVLRVNKFTISYIYDLY